MGQRYQVVFLALEFIDCPVVLFLRKQNTLNKSEHIKYWKVTAADDWRAVQQLFKGRNYIQSLFFAHLVLEKLLKAYWVKDNVSNHPPKTPNLILLNKQTKLNLSETDLQFLASMNDFQLEGRYPDYSNKLFKTYKLKQTKEVLIKIEDLGKCLLKNL